MFVSKETGGHKKKINTLNKLVWIFLILWINRAMLDFKTLWLNEFKIWIVFKCFKINWFTTVYNIKISLSSFELINLLNLPWWITVKLTVKSNWSHYNLIILEVFSCFVSNPINRRKKDGECSNNKRKKKLRTFK